MLHERVRKILIAHFNYRKKAPPVAPAPRILIFGVNSERTPQAFPRELPSLRAQSERLPFSYAPVGGLLFNPLRKSKVHFRSIYKVQPENIVPTLVPDVKTVAVIAWIG